MDHLTTLFKLLELTRAMPQYGYALAGIPRHEQSNLAEHHYLVTFIGWQLARQCRKAGAVINVERVLEICLVHDIAELFGGDIGFHYARTNPGARKAAKLFEGENEKFIAKFFAQDGRYFRALLEEERKRKTDEAIVAKIADYVENNFYKLFVHRLTKNNMATAAYEIQQYTKHVRDAVTKREIARFVRSWVRLAKTGDSIPGIG